MFGLKKIKKDIDELQNACISPISYSINGSDYYDTTPRTANERLDRVEKNFLLLLDHLGLEKSYVDPIPAKELFIKRKAK